MIFGEVIIEKRGFKNNKRTNFDVNRESYYNFVFLKRLIVI